MPYPQCGRSIKTYARGNNDAPITKYGSLVWLNAQIVALRPHARAHCAKGCPHQQQPQHHNHHCYHLHRALMEVRIPDPREHHATPRHGHVLSCHPSSLAAHAADTIAHQKNQHRKLKNGAKYTSPQNFCRCRSFEYQATFETNDGFQCEDSCSSRTVD